jgi:hypothetical protein
MKIEIGINIVCYECGDELEVDSSIDYKDRTTLKITPCPTCLTKAREELANPDDV